MRSAIRKILVKYLNPKRRLAASHRQMETTEMKTPSTTAEHFESTYALIVRSEEKQRSRLEMLLYTLLIASALFAVSQFGREALTIPMTLAKSSAIPTTAQGS